MRKQILGVWGAVVLIAALGSGAAVAMPIHNGDFSQGPNGFDGWGGQRLDTFGAPEDLADPGQDFGRFSASGGFAELRNDVESWQVGIYQQFDLVPTTGSYMLTFDYEWSPTDDSDWGDLLSASLDDGAGLYDLFAGMSNADIAAGSSRSLDVTAFAGGSLELAFFVTDFDFNENDVFRVGNIVITEILPPTGVPAPATLLLLGLGLLGLGVRGRRAA